MIFKRLYVGSGSYTIENRGQISRLLKQEYAKPTLAQYESQESLASSALSFVEQSISALVDTLTKYGDESHSTSDKPRTSVTSLNTTVGSDVLELLSARIREQVSGEHLTRIHKINKKLPLAFLIHGSPQVSWYNSWSYRWSFQSFSSQEQYEILPYQDLQLELTAALNLFNCIDENRVIALDASYGDKLLFIEYDVGQFIQSDNSQAYEIFNQINYISNWTQPITFTAFQRRRVPSKLLFFTDENHWVLNPCNSLVWYQEVLD
ncbi:unnamed protein product [Rotaria socialis]|uniref:Uncharacterized protein n=1 Tax=Rotaria socialis TaxID=392032 RepID=A0A821J8J5_9BILA|nr:unnamed protein product [Rotaria socialis]CAF4368472.1 unnamed protein product [Rotaria socialis]CAF4525532.1 unnamed protein product [Rotaria socialis]CAF4717761.1 unnamed protein product [Rotaria socialis]